MTAPVLPGTWTNRRRVIFAALAFDAAVVAYVLVSGADTEAARTAVSAAFYTGAGIVGSYVFGAVWDDFNARRI